MPDIFDKPWTLLGAAVLVLFGMLTFRSMFPEKRRWWQLLVPALLAAGAFGLDLLVQTDLEKIKTVIKTGMRAVEEEDYNSIGRIISDNYSDSHHSTKQHLLAHCRTELSRSLVEKNKKRGLLIELSEPNATAILFALTTFDENSFIAEYKSFLLIKAKLYLQKQPDKRWLISRVELLEIDRHPVNWSQIR
jgi:hypothetical protein